MQIPNLRFEIKEFVGARLSKFYSDKINTNIDRIGMVLHLIPLSTFYNNNAIDIDLIYNDKNNPIYNLPIMAPDGLSGIPRLNIDGIEISSRISERTVQLFKNGAIEASLLKISSCSNREKSLNLQFIRQILDNCIIKYFEFIRSQKISGPIVLFIKILNVKGFSICLDTKCSSFSDPYENHEIDLGNIEIESNFDNDMLIPFYQILYNAFGKIYDISNNY